MSTHDHYQRIALAIDYIQQHATSQPTLEEIAAAVHLSPAHFQRLFSEWAGTSPKKFLQYLSLDHAKKVLRQSQNNSLLEATLATGLSSTSRLHDLFISIEGMTPADYKNGGKNLSINYAFSASPFGEILIASTTKGICYMAFIEQRETALQQLTAQFPNAQFLPQNDDLQAAALAIFRQHDATLPAIKLHLKGSDFQINVWQSLLKIPQGQLSSYSDIAQSIGSPKASRAVGSAIGSNPVAFLIPCHRMIQSSGALSGYRWGTTRKTAIIGWESANANS